MIFFSFSVSVLLLVIILLFFFMFTSGRFGCPCADCTRVMYLTICFKFSNHEISQKIVDATRNDIYHEKFSEHAVKCSPSNLYLFTSLCFLWLWYPFLVATQILVRFTLCWQQLFQLIDPAPVQIQEFLLIGNLSPRFPNHQQSKKKIPSQKGFSNTGDKCLIFITDAQCSGKRMLKFRNKDKKNIFISQMRSKQSIFIVSI